MTFSLATMHLAKRLSRTAFGIGLAVGLMLNLSLVDLASACSMPASPPCVTLPPEAAAAQAFVDMQCQIHQTLFNDGSEAGVAFRLGDTDITTPGAYPATDWRGEEVQFKVVRAISMDLQELEPELFDQGVIARIVFGRLAGPAGDVNVSGVAIYPKEITLDEEFLLLVSEVLTEPQLAIHEEISRIQAGVRVLDTGTFQSHSLATVTSAATMFAAGADMSSLFATGVNAAGGGEVDASCVEAAYAQYQIAMDAANASMAACLINATVEFAAEMAGCALIAIGSGGTAFFYTHSAPYWFSPTTPATWPTALFSTESRLTLPNRAFSPLFVCAD